MSALGPETRNDALDALRLYRDRNLAQTVLVLVHLVAESHPDELRAALSSVFDLSAVDSAAKRAVLIATEAQQQAKDITDRSRWLLDDVTKDIDRVRAEVEGLEFRLSKAAEAFARLRGTYATARHPAGAA